MPEASHVPAPAIVRGEPAHHVAYVLFESDTDPEGLYADVRIEPPLYDATERYLSLKGSWEILCPAVSPKGATLIEAFAKRSQSETTEDRRYTILSAIAHLVRDLDNISAGTGPWAQFHDPAQDIEVVSTNIAVEE